MNVAVLVLAVTLVVLVALLAGVGAGKLARLDGASYPAALNRAAVTFAAVLTLAAAAVTTFTAFLT